MRRVHLFKSVILLLKTQAWNMRQKYFSSLSFRLVEECCQLHPWRCCLKYLSQFCLKEISQRFILPQWFIFWDYRLIIWSFSQLNIFSFQSMFDHWQKLIFRLLNCNKFVNHLWIIICLKLKEYPLLELQNSSVRRLLLCLTRQQFLHHHILCVIIFHLKFRFFFFRKGLRLYAREIMRHKIRKLRNNVFPTFSAKGLNLHCLSKEGEFLFHIISEIKVKKPQ